MTSQQIKKYERLRLALRRAGREFREYEEKLAVNCNHPEQYVEPYQWEHDNGYGRQHMITGKVCTICRAKKLWESSDYWSK